MLSLIKKIYLSAQFQYLTFQTNPRGQVKVLACMLVYTSFTLIWYATWPNVEQYIPGQNIHAIFWYPWQNIPHRFAAPDKTSHAVFDTPNKTSHAIFVAPEKTSHAISATQDKTSGVTKQHGMYCLGWQIFVGCFVQGVTFRNEKIFDLLTPPQGSRLSSLNIIALRKCGDHYTKTLI